MADSYRYLVHIDVPATHAAVLRDALQDEPLSMGSVLGAEELQRQLDELTISIDVVRDARWDELDSDIEILSTYLAAPVLATEVAVGPDVHAWRLIGRAGEVVRVKLDVARDADGTIDIRGENLEGLAMQLPTLPRWAQSLLAQRLP